MFNKPNLKTPLLFSGRVSSTAKLFDQSYFISENDLLRHIRSALPYYFVESGALAAEGNLTEPFELGQTQLIKVLRKHFETPSTGVALDPALTQIFEQTLAVAMATETSFEPLHSDYFLTDKAWTLAAELDRQSGQNTVHALVDTVLRAAQWGSEQEPLGVVWIGAAVAAYHAVAIYAPNAEAEVAVAAAISQVLLERKQKAEHLLPKGNPSFANEQGFEKGLTLLSQFLALMAEFDRVLGLWKTNGSAEGSVTVAQAGGAPWFNQWIHYGARYERGKSFQKVMGFEVSRHFELKSIRCLRKNPAFRLPLAPFFDQWGERLTKGVVQTVQAPFKDELTHQELAQVIEALVSAWQRRSQSFAYPRALSGILRGLRQNRQSGAETKVFSYLPQHSVRVLTSGLLRSLCSMPQEQFETRIFNQIQWLQKRSS